MKEDLTEAMIAAMKKAFIAAREIDTSYVNEPYQFETFEEYLQSLQS